MPKRPATDDQSGAYYAARDAVPPRLLALAMRAIEGKRNRLYTFNPDFQTQASLTFGEDLYLSICNGIEATLGAPGPWRVYFHKVEDTDYGQMYKEAQRLLAMGFSRRIASLVLKVSPISIKRNVKVAYTETQRAIPVTPEEVNTGYTYLVGLADMESAKSTTICGQVGRALKELGRA